MTICVAATCENGQVAVVATDLMVSASFLSLEFEHPNSKIDQLSNTCVGLAAGDALASIELFRSCIGNVGQLKSPSIEMIADQVKDQFILLRQKSAEDNILKCRGLTISQFYHEGLLNRLPPELAINLDHQIQNARFPIDIIITGVDDSGAHIYGIRDPGVISCYDRLGYQAIGSGMSHALLTLISGNQYDQRGINETVYLVYEAKKTAELAQGVGDATVMGIVTAKGMKLLTKDEKMQLDEIYEKKKTPRLEAVQDAISKLPYGGKDDKTKS